MELYIRSLLRQHSDLNRILICLDAEDSKPDELLKQTAQPVRQLNRGSTVPVRYSVVDHALEDGSRVMWTPYVRSSARALA